MATELAEQTANENVSIPPTVDIKARGDRMRSFMATGEKTAEKPPEKPAEKAAEKAPEKPVEKAPEKPAADAPLVPELKAAPKVEIKPDAKVDDKKAKKIPHEEFEKLSTKAKAESDRATAAEQRAAELEEKLNKAVATIPAYVEEKLKKLPEYEKLIQTFYVEHDPKFKAAFDEKIEGYKVDAVETVGIEAADKLKEVLAAPSGKWRDAQIEEIANELPAFKQIGLQNTYSALRKLEKERAIEKAKAPENFERLTALKKDELKASMEAESREMESALTSSIQKAAQHFHEFRRVDGEDDHNKVVAENESLVRKWAAANKPTERANVLTWAVKGYRSAETDAIKDALISKLQTQLKELQGANPDLGGGEGKSADKGKPSGFMAKFKQAQEHGIPKE
jgi:Fe2+ or Zn2+ uptake regulation protein